MPDKWWLKMQHQFSQFQQEVQSERWEHQPLLEGAVGDSGMLMSPTVRQKVQQTVQISAQLQPDGYMTGKPSSVPVMVGKSGVGMEIEL